MADDAVVHAQSEARRLMQSIALRLADVADMHPEKSKIGGRPDRLPSSSESCGKNPNFFLSPGHWLPRNPIDTNTWQRGSPTLCAIA